MDYAGCLFRSASFHLISDEKYGKKARISEFIIKYLRQEIYTLSNSQIYPDVQTSAESENHLILQMDEFEITGREGYEI